MQVYHGTRPIAELLSTDFVSKTDSFYDRVRFNKWVELKSVRMCSLPRESRLVFTLYGRILAPTNPPPGQEVDRVARPVKRELCWGSLQLFNFERALAQGTFLLPLWPRAVEKQIGPAPDPGSHPSANSCPVLSLELPELGSRVIFPDKIPIQPPPRQDYNFKGRKSFFVHTCSFSLFFLLCSLCFDPLCLASQIWIT